MHRHLIVLCWLGTLAACKSRATEDALSEPQSHADSNTSSDTAAFGFNDVTAGSVTPSPVAPINGAQLKGAMAQLAALSPQMRTLPCPDINFKNPRNDTVRVSNQFDLTKCLQNLLGPPGKKILSALLRYYGEFACEGESLERYAGLNFFDLNPTACLTAGRAYWRQQLEWQLLVKNADGVPSSIKITEVTRAPTEPGYCTAIKEGDTWVYQPCAYFVRTLGTDANTDKELITTITGSCQRRTTASAGTPSYFASGRCVFKIADWDIALNFRGANTAPQWTAQEEGRFSQTDETEVPGSSGPLLLHAVVQLLH